MPQTFKKLRVMNNAQYSMICPSQTCKFRNFHEGFILAKLNLKGFMLTLQETRSIHDSMNLPKIEFITYIYILL